MQFFQKGNMSLRFVIVLLLLMREIELNKRLPIRKNEIRSILNSGDVYVDKTDYALKLIDKRNENENKRHFLMARPNRFGKTLFVDTLEEIFKGEKELFRNTCISRSNYTWPKFPVLRFDFRLLSSANPDIFAGKIEEELRSLCIVNKLPVRPGLPFATVLSHLVIDLSEKYNRAVVVLVDEYDVPYLENSENLYVLAEFFVGLRRVRSYLHFTFVTGTYIFSLIALSVQDITTDPDFAEIMGYTEDDLRNNFKSHIERFAEIESTNVANVYDELSRQCSGYRFSSEPCWVYNPHSVLEYLHNDDGTVPLEPARFVLEHVLRKPVTFRFLTDGLISVRNHQLVDIPIFLNRSNLPGLLYQTGTLTINEYRPRSNCCSLAFPNNKQEDDFRKKLAEEFFSRDVQKDHRRMGTVQTALKRLDFNIFICEMSTYFENSVFELFPYEEKYYRAYVFTFFEACGLEPQGIRRTNVSMMGVQFTLGKRTFMIRLQVDGNSQEALNQARIDKEESAKDKTETVCVVGINFNSVEKIHTWQAMLFLKSGAIIRKFSSADSFEKVEHEISPPRENPSDQFKE